MKKIKCILCGAILCMLFTACDINNSSQSNDAKDSQTVNSSSKTDSQTDQKELNTSENADSIESEGTLIETDYGSYILPDGWYEYDQISTSEKVFYLKEGIATESVSSNISVECGENKYAADDHLDFRTAIMQQLGNQISGEDAELTAHGSSTAAGYVLYVFTISEDDVTTSQYYIIGDKRYVLIHVTDLMDERTDDVNAVAGAIADSFIWE